MAELQPIPFGVQAYSPRSSGLRIELAENLYAEQTPESAKGSIALIGTPGLKPFANVGTGPIRGMRALNNQLFVVSGTRLYRVNQNTTTVDLGEIAGAGPVSIIATTLPADDSVQLSIVTNDPAYYYANGVLGQLPESNLTGATYQDGYGLYTQRNTENLFWSGIDDFSTLSALSVTQADALPDKVVGLISDHREVWVFGQNTTEVFVNTGNATSPFVRTGGGFIEHGCVASKSIAKAENRVFWLSGDGRVYSAQGYAAQPISTPAIEYEISLEDTPDAATAFTYTQEGHTFYVLSFSGRTLVFDLTTGLWHKRKSPGIARWRGGSYERVWRKQLVGDYALGKIYELDLGTYTDNSEAITRTTISAPLYAGGKRMLMDEVVIDIDAGLGLPTGQGSDPLIMFDWTHDGGRTFSHTRTRSMGKIGQYKKQVRFHALGSFRERSLRIRVTDPIPVRILGVYGRIEAVEG